MRGKRSRESRSSADNLKSATLPFIILLASEFPLLVPSSMMSRVRH
jgi:hypothetical protein